MNVFIQIAHGAIGAVGISLFFILRSSFGEARHTLSIIGAIAILIASSYIIRTRLIRWGRRQIWLKYHQRLASLGLFLVLIHSAAQPQAWHSWLTLSFALLNLGTGIAVSFTSRGARRILLRCHLALAPILLISVILHGREKLDHDDFLPLTEAHDVPCVRCHTPDALLFRANLPFPINLETGGTVPDDLHWMFESNGLPLPQNTTIQGKEADGWWTITDREKKQAYRAQQAEEQFSVYADSRYEAYTCVNCHEHNTPEIKFAHEIHGVTSYHRCFICHQTVIDGLKYGKQKANWEYDPNW